MAIIVYTSYFSSFSTFLIMSEERWCIMEFGEEYIKYMNKVRRYI